MLDRADIRAVRARLRRTDWRALGGIQAYGADLQLWQFCPVHCFFFFVLLVVDILLDFEP